MDFLRDNGRLERCRSDFRREREGDTGETREGSIGRPVTERMRGLDLKSFAFT